MSFQVRHLGVWLRLASPWLLGFLLLWEAGGRVINVVYPDKLAGGEPTVCSGITRHTWQGDIVVGDYWSDEKCAEITRIVVERGQISLLDCIRYPITQPVFDALSSMAHNLGNGNVCASRALGLINEGRLIEGCEAIAHRPDGVTPVWSYVGTGFVRGLYNRRLAERDRCREGAG